MLRHTAAIWLILSATIICCSNDKGSGQVVPDVFATETSGADSTDPSDSVDRSADSGDFDARVPDATGADMAGTDQGGPSSLVAPTAEVVELTATNGQLQLTPAADTPSDAVLGVAFGEREMPDMGDLLSAEVGVGGASLPVGLNSQLRPLTRYYARPYVRLGEQVVYGAPLDPFDTPFFVVGDSYADGTVADVDDNRALLVHTSASSALEPFGCDGLDFLYPVGGDSYDKTQAILQACPDAAAAGYCAALESEGGVSSWALADSADLNKATNVIGAPPNEVYWVSKEPTSSSTAQTSIDGSLGSQGRDVVARVPCVASYYRRSRGIATGISTITAPSVDDPIDGGEEEYCGTVACEPGQTALGGGGFIPLGRYKTFSSPDPEDLTRLQRCLVGKVPTLNPADGVLKGACAVVDSDIRVAISVTDVSSDQPDSLSPKCFPDEVLVGGGGGGSNLELTANGPAMSGSQRVWRVGGAVLPGVDTAELRAYALCAKGVERPALVTRKTVLGTGSQCANVDCPEGMLSLTGGGIWGVSMESARSSRGAAGDWVVCANQSPGDETLTLAVLCTPALD